MIAKTTRHLAVVAISLLCSPALVAQSPWMYDAVAHDSETGKYYFFFGRNYVVKDPGQPIDGLIRDTQQDWGLPESWGGGDIDAAVYVPDNNAYYFFKDGQYAKKPRGEGKRCEAPKDVQQEWGTPAHWNGRVDGVCYKTTTNTYYLFRGNEYAAKERGKPTGAAKPITDWGLPPDQKILGVEYTGVDKNPLFDVGNIPGLNKYYFFYGTGYLRKDEGKAAGQLGEYRGDFRWKARPKTAWVGVACEGAYALKYRVDWTQANGRKKHKEGTRTLGLSAKIELPRDVTKVRVRGEAYNPFDDNISAFDETFSSPPNTYYVATGDLTKVRHRTGAWKSPLDDIEQGLEDAWDAISDWTVGAFETLAEATIIDTATRAMADNSQLIAELVTAASAAAVDASPYTALATQLAQAVSGGKVNAADVAKTTIKTALSSPHFRRLTAMASSNPFDHLSVGLNIGAAKFVGAGASVGGSVSAKNGAVSLSVGGAASLSADVGPSGGISFGVERPGGSMGYVAVGLPGPNGTEVEVVVSVPAMRVEGFTVTISPPGKKTAKKAVSGSISTGYSYEIF